MTKNGLNANGMGHAKYSVWIKILKLPKTCEKRFYKHIKVVLCKKWLLKTTNIRRIRTFSK